MRMSDWSSDVCSSDLRDAGSVERVHQLGLTSRRIAPARQHAPRLERLAVRARRDLAVGALRRQPHLAIVDRTRDVQGKRVSVRVALGGRRIMKKKRKMTI